MGVSTAFHRTLCPGSVVLVHGAWVGEWSWLPVLPMMRASGRPFFVVSLTGHGARRHQSGPEVGLSTHVGDVVALLEAYDLLDVTLVGHSYGGRVITKAWAEVPDRIRSLVYLDAHAPIAPEPAPPPGRAALAAEHGGMLPFHEKYRPTEQLVGDVDWFMSRVEKQSAACFAEPWQVELPNSGLAKTYVHATAGEDTRFDQYAASAARRNDWTLHSLPGSHWLMWSHPAEVAAIILDA